MDSYNYKDLFETVLGEINSKIGKLRKDIKFCPSSSRPRATAMLDAYQRMREYALKAKAEMGVE